MPSKIPPIQFPNSTALALYADRDPIAVEETAAHDTQGVNEAFAWTRRREPGFELEHDGTTGLHDVVKIARAVLFFWWDNYNHNYHLDPTSTVNEMPAASSGLAWSHIGGGTIEIIFPEDFGIMAIQSLTPSERSSYIGGGYSLDWNRVEMVDGGVGTWMVVERFGSGPWKDGPIAFAVFGYTG